MFKHLRNEIGEAALAAFLIGLIFTFVVGAVQQNKLKAQLETCEAPVIMKVIVAD